MQLKTAPDVEKPIRAGHPWVYREALTTKPRLKGGELVDITDGRGKFVARGYYDADSPVAVRVLTRDESEAIDADFFHRRLQKALSLRKAFIDFGTTNAYRLANAEGDYLPGLVVDVYAGYALIQVYSLGLRPFRDMVCDALTRLLSPTGVYEKNRVKGVQDAADCQSELLRAADAPDELEILENGVKFLVNLKTGQSTGIFLDQRENRPLVRRLSAGKDVLNCFSYTAAFSVHAALGGAASVTSVDLSRKANEWGQRHFTLNGLDPSRGRFITGDVFDWLKRFARKQESFDLVILDPPTFSTGPKGVFAGVKGYQKLNVAALGVLRKGGVLICSSNSGEISPKMFYQALQNATADARVDLQLVDVRFQPPDHPVNVFFPEGRYLKFYVSVVR